MKMRQPRLVVLWLALMVPLLLLGFREFREATRKPALTPLEIQLVQSRLLRESEPTVNPASLPQLPPSVFPMEATLQEVFSRERLTERGLRAHMPILGALALLLAGTLGYAAGGFPAAVVLPVVLFHVPALHRAMTEANGLVTGLAMQLLFWLTLWPLAFRSGRASLLHWGIAGLATGLALAAHPGNWVPVLVGLIAIGIWKGTSHRQGRELKPWAADIHRHNGVRLFYVLMLPAFVLVPALIDGWFMELPPNGYERMQLAEGLPGAGLLLLGAAVWFWLRGTAPIRRAIMVSLLTLVISLLLMEILGRRREFGLLLFPPILLAIVPMLRLRFPNLRRGHPMVLQVVYTALLVGAVFAAARDQKRDIAAPPVPDWEKAAKVVVRECPPESRIIVATEADRVALSFYLNRDGHSRRIWTIEREKIPMELLLDEVRDDWFIHQPRHAAPRLQRIAQTMMQPVAGVSVDGIVLSRNLGEAAIRERRLRNHPVYTSGGGELAIYPGTQDSPYVGFNWKEIEDWAEGGLRAMSEGPAEIWFVSNDSAPAEIRIHAYAFRAELEPKLTLQLQVNGTPIEDLEALPGWTVFTYPVPEGVIKKGINKLSLTPSRTLSPADVEPGSPDQRQLSFWINWVRIK